MVLGVCRKKRRIQSIKTGYELGKAAFNAPQSLSGPVFTTKELCQLLRISSRRRVYDVLNLLFAIGWVKRASVRQGYYVSLV